MLVVFGAINLDLVFAVPALPAAGDTVQATRSWLELGGKGAVQAVAAARDAAPVTLVGSIGRDLAGRRAQTDLRRARVTLRGVTHRDADTGRAAIAVAPDGHTSTAAHLGANARLRAAHVPDALLGPRTTLLLQTEADPAENAALLVRAKRRGSRVILNLSPARVFDPAAARMADLLVGNSPELAWAGEHLGTASNPASLHAALGVACVRMMGAQGAQLMSNEGFLHMPAMPVRMRDTTAAGDCFVGVLAGAIARGQSPGAAMRRAAVAAALSTTAIGALRSLPKSADIDAQLAHAPRLSAEQSEVPD